MGRSQSYHGCNFLSLVS